MASGKSHILMNTMVGARALTNFEFDQAFPYAGCRICGRVFQPAMCRKESVPIERRVSLVKTWRVRHAHTHSIDEHRLLALSGQWATPLAQTRLAPFGIVDMTDRGQILNSESDQALIEAPRAPIDDADGLSSKDRWLTE